MWLILDLVGLRRSNLICFSYTSSALRRSVVYARIVVPLLYSSGFILESFKGNVRVDK